MARDQKSRLRLLEYVRSKARPDEKVLELTPTLVVRRMEDGSLILYKNLPAIGLTDVVLSSRDLDALRNLT